MDCKREKPKKPAKAEPAEDEPAEAELQEKGRGSTDPATQPKARVCAAWQRHKTQTREKGAPAKVKAEEFQPAKAEKRRRTKVPAIPQLQRMAAVPTLLLQ